MSEFAKIADTKVGDVLVPDGDFECMQAGIPRTVHQDDAGLFINCQKGKHHLDGQIEGDFYIGLYNA